MQLVWDCHPILTVVITLATLLQSLLPAAISYVSKLIVDSVVRATQEPEEVWSIIIPVIALAAGIGAAEALIEQVRNLAQELLGNLLSNHINEMIVSHATTLDLSFYENPQFYDMLRRAREEAGFRPLRLVTQLLTIAGSVITTFSLLALLLRFNLWIVVVLVLTALPALFVQAHYGQKAYRLLSGRAPESRQLSYYTHLLSSDRNSKEIKLFNLARLFLDRYKAIFARFYRQDRALLVRRSVFGVALAALSLLGYYGCYVYVIGRTVEGLITLGDLTMYVLVFQQLQQNLTELLLASSTIYESTLFLSNLFAFLNLRPILVPPVNGQRPPAQWQKGFVFHNVSFRYPGTAPYVLRNVNLHIQPQEKIALVGENGAGKTTLVKLLTRLYDPTEGHITFDGVDLREYDLESLYNHIGVIFQDFVCYHLSARENIGLGQVEMLDNQERIIAAAQKSGVHDAISQLPLGYETILGRWFKEGCQLSLGEWQKIALARALMRDAGLLILDEPTASLDARTEYQIFQRFSELVHDRAVVLISHRFGTVCMADRIIVLRGGQVIETGTHEQLLDQQGLYAKLFNMQAEPFIKLNNL